MELEVTAQAGAARYERSPERKTYRNGYREWWVIVGCADGRKVVVSVTSGARESVEAWSGVLRDLRDPGLRAPRLVVADGHLGC